MATTPDAGRSDRAVGARVGAVVVASGWVTFFFGLIDLMASVIPADHPRDERFAVLAASWGLLYMVLLPVPLIAWAVRPAGWVGPQIVSIAVAVLFTGIAGLAPGQVVAAFLVAACAAFPRMWRPRPRWSTRRALVTPGLWPLDAVVAIGVVAAAVHGWDVLDAARRGVEDDNTVGLMHLPMQAGFALAVPVAAAVAVLALANRVAGWWLAFVPPAVSAVWFGAVSIRHPDVVGSPGEPAGTATVCWGVLLLAGAWGIGSSMRAAAPADAIEEA